MDARRLYGCLLWLALSLLPLGAASAAWYQVELIVFRHTVPAAPEDAEVAPLEPPPFLSVPVTPLTDAVGSLRMRDIYTLLQQSNRYQPLLHLAWRQPANNRSAASAVAIPAGWTPESPAPATGPYGLVRIYQQRFLHVELDLRLPTADGVQVNRQSRRINSNEIHYLDHPELGALLLVTPL